jgi:hypothetical protein
MKEAPRLIDKGCDNVLPGRAVAEYDAMSKLLLLEETLTKLATDQVEAQYMWQ